MDVFLGEWMKRAPQDAHVLSGQRSRLPERHQPACGRVSYVEGEPVRWHHIRHLPLLGPLAKRVRTWIPSCCGNLSHGPVLMGLPRAGTWRASLAQVSAMGQLESWPTIPSYRISSCPCGTVVSRSDTEEDKELMKDLIALGYVSAGATATGAGGTAQDQPAAGSSATTEDEGERLSGAFLNEAGALRQQGDLAGAEQVLRKGTRRQPRPDPHSRRSH